MRRAVCVGLVLLAVEAGAAGFYFGDNGTKALMTGGAFAGEADDLSAIQHNPGGLTQLSGFHFLLDVELLNHDVSFLRKDPGGTGAVPNTVTNQGGIFVLPFAAFGYGLDVADRPLTLAVGVYGPPSVGRYKYPAPNYEKDAQGRYLENPRKFAPQRYALVHNDVIILFPGLSVAYAPHPRVSAGFSLQYVYSKFLFNQVVYSGLTEPKRQADE